MIRTLGTGKVDNSCKRSKTQECMNCMVSHLLLYLSEYADIVVVRMEEESLLKNMGMVNPQRRNKEEDQEQNGSIN